MSVIINGRGIVSNYQPDESDIPVIKKEFKLITVEEYRKLDFTPEQEWNELYCPKRCSIEALDNIEIRKRGKGPIKNIYINSEYLIDGPYYDPYSTHLHVWKNHNAIKNFIGEQNQNVEYVQFTNFKPGIYCSICHKKNLFKGLVWDKRPNKIQNKRPIARQIDRSCENDKYVPYLNLKESFSNLTEPNIIVSKWSKILYKVLYMANNEKNVYPISKFKSLMLWPWEMTRYQKFKFNNQNYRDSCIFIKSDNLKFDKDCVIIFD